MTGDSWTITVLGLALAVLVRPATASLLQRYGPIVHRHRYNPERAGGGAAMLALAFYLISGPSHVVGQGYWNLADAAITDPFVRLLPMVWIPTLSWLLLIGFGGAWLFVGIRGYRGPRRPMMLVWALNEIAICAALLILGVYVPDEWKQAELINFGLEGLYLSFLIGAVLRFALVLLNPGGPSHPIDPRLAALGSAWLGRMRRY